jgi:hypothetical protein
LASELTVLDSIRDTAAELGFEVAHLERELAARPPREHSEVLMRAALMLTALTDCLGDVRRLLYPDGS